MQPSSPTAGSLPDAHRSAPSSRTQHHRKDRRKAHGVHYTPPELAQFLATEALEELGDLPSVVLDPACGEGELLEATWRSLSPQAQQTVSFVGLDTDPAAVDACRARLDGLGPANVKVHEADFLLALAQRGPQTSLFDGPGEVVTAGSVDLAIANPPYVRTQTLGQPRVAEVVRRYGITGRVDLYMAFAFGMAEVLRPGGVMALLCSNRFLTTRGGFSLRKLLSAEFSIGAIFDLGDTRMFEAAVLPAVIIATKRGNRRAARFVSVYRSEECIEETTPRFSSVPELVASKRIGSAQVDQTPLRVRRGVLADSSPGQPWTLHDDATADILARLAAATDLTIGSVTKILVGIKTTADTVFIRDDWELLPQELLPEPELLHPLLTHHVTHRWRAENPRKRILYPHESRDTRTIPVNLDRYPRAAAYLASNRERLSSREYVTAAGRQWFEIWVPQKAHLWSRPKVVFPDIAQTPRFLVDTEGHLVNGDCYWATTSSLEEALLIAAIGNSALAGSFYDAQCANQLYAGRRRFMTQYVERFPLPDPASAAAEKIISLARDIYLGLVDQAEAEEELEALIRRSLGFEEATG
jgi:adenine-specific DNA-methyltransferase